MGDVPVEGEAVAVAKGVSEWNVRLGVAYGEVQALEEGGCEGGGVDGGDWCTGVVSAGVGATSCGSSLFRE